MSVRVLVPPTPVVAPTDIPGAPSDVDFVKSLIAAAQETIDGPTGWLGRALGEQILEYRGERLPSRLPYPPLIEVLSVTIDGEAAELPSWLDNGDLSWANRRCGRDVVITYKAGYDGDAVADGGTGELPDRVKVAVTLMVQDQIRTLSSKIGVREETVDDVGSKTYSDPGRISEHVRRSAEHLLAGLRLWS